MSNFHVGQKVVCVDDAPNGYGEQAPISKGVIYTVKDICRGMSARGPDVGLVLFEVDNMPGFHKGYSQSRFRPVVERKTDISVFRAMLNTSKQQVSA